MNANEYLWVVTVVSDSSEPWVYGPFETEQEAIRWAEKEERRCHLEGDCYDYYNISSLIRPLVRT